MLRLSQATCTVCCAALLLLAAGPAQADTWDLQLSRLCQIYVERGGPLDCGGGYDPVQHGNVKAVIADNPAFRSLMSELGAVFAPNILAPSDTQGYGGFSFNVEFGWTMINPKKNSADFLHTNPNTGADAKTSGHRFWRAAGSVSDKAFAKGNIRDTSQFASEIDRLERELPPSFAPTVTLMGRKGIWFGAAGMELGLGARHLIGSKMWMPQAQVKMSLHEGYQGWPVPAIAVRASGGRVMGTPDFNLNIVGLDGSMSKHFGIASSFNLTPYLGYQFLWFIADAEVMDATPGVDPMNELTKPGGALTGKGRELLQCRHIDCNGNFSFDDQSNITRHRIFVGLKANFYIASLLLEYTYFFKGSTTDELRRYNSVLNQVVPETIQDSAGGQHTINISLGFDY